MVPVHASRHGHQRTHVIVACMIGLGAAGMVAAQGPPREWSLTVVTYESETSATPETLVVWLGLKNESPGPQLVCVSPVGSVVVTPNENPAPAQPSSQRPCDGDELFRLVPPSETSFFQLTVTAKAWSNTTRLAGDFNLAYRDPARQTESRSVVHWETTLQAARAAGRAIASRR